MPHHAILPSCTTFLSEYNTTMLITAVRRSSLVKCMERMPCWPWANSAYVCIAACEWLNLTVVRMHDNHVHNGPGSIFAVWIYATGVVLALDDQLVRLYSCVWLRVVIGVRCGRTYDEEISPSCAMLLSKYNATMLQRPCIDLRWLNVWWNGCRVGPGQTGRTFVLLSVSDRIWRCY